MCFINTNSFIVHYDFILAIKKKNNPCIYLSEYFNSVLGPYIVSSLNVSKVLLSVLH